MKVLSKYDARTHAQSVWNLYAELEPKFGAVKAWEFVLNFYKGAGSE